MVKLAKKSRRKRSRKHGFLHRMSTRSGKTIVKRRRASKRKRLAVTV